MRTHPEFVSAVFPEKLGLVTANQERHENQEQSANDRFVLFLEKKKHWRRWFNLESLDKPVDLLRTKLIYLISTLCVVLYNGMAAFQYCEATFGNINYSIIDSM